MLSPGYHGTSKPARYWLPRLQPQCHNTSLSRAPRSPTLEPPAAGRPRRSRRARLGTWPRASRTAGRRDSSGDRAAVASRIFRRRSADRPIGGGLARHGAGPGDALATGLAHARARERESRQARARIRQCSLPLRSRCPAYTRSRWLLARALQPARGRPVRPPLYGPDRRRASQHGGGRSARLWLHPRHVPRFPASSGQQQHQLQHRTSTSSSTPAAAARTYLHADVGCSPWGTRRSQRVGSPPAPCWRPRLAVPFGRRDASYQGPASLSKESLPYGRARPPTRRPTGPAETCMRSSEACPSILQGYCTRVLVAGGPPAPPRCCACLEARRPAPCLSLHAASNCSDCSGAPPPASP